MKAIFLFLSCVGAAPVWAQGLPAFVWQLTCDRDAQQTWGPFSTPDQCREKRARVTEICEHPLDGPNRPNADFVRIAAVCKDAHNGRDCVCEYWMIGLQGPVKLAP